jgi:hypothetical protein
LWSIVHPRLSSLLQVPVYIGWYLEEICRARNSFNCQQVVVEARFAQAARLRSKAAINPSSRLCSWNAE